MEHSADPTRERLLKHFSTRLVEFGRVVNPRDVRLPSPDFHYEMGAAMTDPAVKRLVIQAPRGFAKTTVGINKVVHHLFLDDIIHRRRSGRPKFVVLASKSLYHAKKVLDSVKGVIEESEFIRDVFGDFSPGTHRIERTDEIVLRNGSILLARGTGQQSRGLNVRGVRPTFVLVDDPEDVANTRSIEMMERNFNEWLLKEIVKGLCDEFGDKIVVIGTPVHELGMVNKLERFAQLTASNPDFKSAKAGWHSLHYSGIKADGTSLWPEKVSVEDMELEKAYYQEQGRVSVFYSEVMCQIVRDEDATFDSWMYWKGRLEEKNGRHYLIVTHRSKNPLEDPRVCVDETGSAKPRILPVNVFMGVDPAKSTSLRADKTAIVPVAIDGAHNFYVLPYFLGRKKPLGVIEEMMRMYSVYKPIITRLEETGAEAIKDFLTSDLVDARIPGLSIKTRPLQRKKTSKLGEPGRLDSLQPYFGQNRMFLQPGMVEAESQLRMYPNGAEDDWLDGLYWAVQSAYRPMHSADEYKLESLPQYNYTGSWATC